MVPEPMACTEEAALWLKKRIAMGIPIVLETAARTLHITEKMDETMYTVRRPAVLEKEDHNRGHRAILIFQSDSERFVTERLALRSDDVCCRAAIGFVSYLCIRTKVERGIPYGTSSPTVTRAAADATKGDDPCRTPFVIFRVICLFDKSETG